MAKSPKPQHALNHGGKRRTTKVKRKSGTIGLLTEKENMTALRWQTIIERVANGDDMKAAARAASISVRTIDAFLISNVAASGQLREARLIWNRNEWPMEKIESVLAEIALGKTVRQAFDAADIDRKHLGSMYRILLKDKAIRSLYDEARELASESMADEIVDISDSRSTDRDEDGKINHEVINRDRLRVDTRKFLMGRYVPKRFGDNKHIQLDGSLEMNHAAVLSGGRKRLEKLHAQRKGATLDHDSGQVVINE